MAFLYKNQQSVAPVETTLEKIHAPEKTYDLLTFSQWAEKMPEAILLLDSQGKILAVNRHASRLINKSQHKLIRSNFCDEISITEQNRNFFPV